MHGARGRGGRPHPSAAGPARRRRSRTLAGVTTPAPTTRPPEPRRETLAECWTRLAAGRPSWTLDVLDVLEPHVLGRPADARDVVRYRDLPGAAAAQLLRRVPPARLADRQNAAPSLASVLTAAARHPDVVEVHGYLVPPPREDERIAAEGIVVHDHPGLGAGTLLDAGDGPGPEEGAVLWARVQARFGLDDARGGPQVLRRRACPRTGRAGWYLWWT